MNTSFLNFLIILGAIGVGIFIYFNNPKSAKKNSASTTQTIDISKYVNACINYAKQFTLANYDSTLQVTDKSLLYLKSAPKKITVKSRGEIANDKGEVNIMEVYDIKVIYKNNPSFILSCWIKYDFTDSPDEITSYDVLQLKITNPYSNSQENQDNITENNF